MNIQWFNASGDGESDDTEAFEKALQLISDRGGGRLVLPPAHYRLRPINLTSHLVLFLHEGARMTAISSEDVWPLLPPLPSYGRGYVSVESRVCMECSLRKSHQTVLLLYLGKS